MSLRLKQRVHLINGKWDERDESDRTGGLPFSGLTLEEVEYAHLSSEETEDAIVVLRYDSGGTQNHYWVYIYGTVGGKARLLGFFHAGDRAYHGLYRTFVKDRTLNVELFDPRYRAGDCCSTRFSDFRFRWSGQGFEPIGSPSTGHADSSSRRPISVFGIHE